MAVKGKTNNPNGRPKKGETISDIIRDMLSKKDAGNKKQRRLVLAETIYNQAIGGDTTAQKLLCHYDAGMPVQMNITAAADDETTKAMRDHARKIFGGKREAKDT